jgi:hypothetical protein
MRRIHPLFRFGLPMLLGLGLLVGCATLREVAALRQVTFGISRVSGLRIAGIPLDGLSSYGDLRAVDVARLAAAIATRQVPLDLTVHVRAENPATNSVTARLVALEWKLFLRDRETIAGRQSGTFVLPPGEPVDVPIETSFEVTHVFGAAARDLVALALDLAGNGTNTVPLRIEATPTIETPIGPMRFPAPVIITRTP